MTSSHQHLHAPVPGNVAARAVRRVFIVTLVLNLAVAIAKAGYGYWSGSLALGTDAIHAALDASSNILALFSLQWSQAPADERHPYGRQKMEIVAALGIGVLIVIGLSEMTAAAVRALSAAVAGSGSGTHPGPQQPWAQHPGLQQPGAQHPGLQIGWWGFGIVGATMVINFFVTRYEEQRGHALGSSLLCADAQHTRSDLYASAAVLLSFIGVRLGLRWADPLGAMFVVFMVGRAAWIVFRDNVPTLIDAAVLDPKRVAHLAGTVSDACDVDVGRVRSRGLRNAVQLDLHVAVDPSMSVLDAHLLATKIEKTLRTAYPELSDVVIHTGPSDTSSTALRDAKISDKPVI